MENKMVRVSFAVEIAKKITNGEVNGNIVTRDGRNARVICWDKKSDSIYNIVALLDEKIMERILTYTINGSEADGKDSDNDLMLEIPEYMTFKDGDVIAFGVIETFIGIFKSVGCSVDTHSDYVVLTHENNLRFDGNAWTFINSRKATEEEKQKLIDALKASKEPKTKECLKKLGVEVKQEYEFKPFDKVLVRNSLEMEWIPRFFERATQCSQSVRYITLDNNSWKYCIPYNDQTAHLLGTDKDLEE